VEGNPHKRPNQLEDLEWRNPHVGVAILPSAISGTACRASTLQKVIHIGQTEITVPEMIILLTP